MKPCLQREEQRRALRETRRPVDALVEAECAAYATLERNLEPGGNLHDLARTVCRDFAVSVTDVLSTARSVAMVDARREIAWKLRELGFSFPEIGTMLRRDHTTVIALVKSRARELERKNQPVGPVVTRPRQLTFLFEPTPTVDAHGRPRPLMKGPDR